MTRIAAQLSPQRSTQYSNLPRDLAAAEVLASPLGAGLQDLSLRSIAGQDYLQFDLPGPITSEAARLLASMAMLGGIFELFDAIGDVAGPLLRPVQATHPAFLSPDMAATRRYKGKTNEAFTHFLCNMAKYASDFHSSDWSTLDVVDPLCGGGTTLFTALSLGADVAGLDVDRTDIESRRASSPSIAARTASRLAPRKSACASSVRGAGCSRSAGTTCAAACWPLAMPDGPASCCAGFGRPHLIVTDLPYGIQHSRPLHGLLADCLPGWTELLQPGGAMAFSWDSTRLDRQEMIALVGKVADSRGRRPAALRSPGASSRSGHQAAGCTGRATR